MTAVDSGANESGRAGTRTEEAPAPKITPVGPLAGNPSLMGLPTFIAGSVALGLALVGVVPATAIGAALPIILSATATGLFIAAIWSAALGASAVAAVYGIFAGFWLSYAVLVLGLFHNWFAITLPAVAATQKLFLISWLVVIVMLTLATLRLPVAFTILFGLVDVALLLLLLGITQASTSLTKAGGYVVLVFAALGAYLFFDVASQATGGEALPLGKPLLRG
jgi:hypothetical protein